MAQPLKQLSALLLQQFKQTTLLFVRGAKKRRGKSKYVLKSSASIPKGGPVPPDYKTVAYIPIPPHLEVDAWQKRGLDRKSPVLWHENWQMQKDARKRALCVLHGPLRTRLNCLRYNGFLPLELKQLADQEICWLPKQSNRDGIKNRCIYTSRARSNKLRWRMSRFMFRGIADHGKLSGVMRAKW